MNILISDFHQDIVILLLVLNMFMMYMWMCQLHNKNKSLLKFNDNLEKYYHKSLRKLEKHYLKVKEK